MLSYEITLLYFICFDVPYQVSVEHCLMILVQGPQKYIVKLELQTNCHMRHANTLALVWQSKLSVSGKDFWLTLIARRSRHFAGTRFLKRGVNEKGRVANDVETEQIVFEDTSDGIPSQMASVVQHRGSIPLVWFQETSRLNIRPDIICRFFC